MKNRKENKSIDYFLTWVVIPAILLFIWFLASILFTSQYSFSVIAIPHSSDNFIKYKTTELHANDIVSAEFQAKENNLGIVSVRFNNFQRISQDIVIFRIKEKSAIDWYYENNYKVDQFQSNGLFTFGFPIISDAKGKIYYFEIESTAGKRGDAIGLSSIYPQFVTQYQYPKELLISDKYTFLEFFSKKMLYSFSDRNFTLSSLVYILPLIFYLVWCYKSEVLLKLRFTPLPKIHVQTRSIRSNSKRINFIFTYIYLFVLILLIIYMDVNNILITIPLLTIWIWQVWYYRFSSNISYLFTLILLILCPLLLIFNLDNIAEKSANWAYFFLVIGVIHSLLEVKGISKPLINYDYFLNANYQFINRILSKSKSK